MLNSGMRLVCAIYIGQYDFRLIFDQLSEVITVTDYFNSGSLHHTILGIIKIPIIFYFCIFKFLREW